MKEQYTVKKLLENYINLFDIINGLKLKWGWENLNDTLEFDKTERNISNRSQQVVPSAELEIETFQLQCKFNKLF